MSPTSQVIEESRSFTLCLRFGRTCWCLAAIALLSAVLTLSCGGGTTPPLIVQVSVTPRTVQVVLRGQVQFAADVSGSSAGVSWSVNGAGGGSSVVGTIDNTGLYTAPTTLPVPNTVTVTAVSLAEPTQSAAATVTIVNPAPTISSISPATALALSGATLLTVTGSGFTPQSTLAVNGSAFPATLVSSTEFTASMSAHMLAQPAAFNLVVTNPAPGGGTSSAATFTVLAQGSVTPTGNLQVALYSFSSPRDASVSIEFGTDTTYGLHTWAQKTPPGGGAVAILVAGMKANTTYHMRADVSFPEGTQFVDTDHTFATGGLPTARVPQITVTNPNGLTPTPGAILLHLSGPGGPGQATNKIKIAAVDNAGNVVWYYDPPYAPGAWLPNPIKLLPNGHMLVDLGLPIGVPGSTPGSVQVPTPSTVREIDLAGNTIYEFNNNDLTNWLNAAGYNLTVTSFHMDFAPLPNGHLILIFWYTKNCTEIPGCVGTFDVLVDALVDLDENHKPVWVWDALDHLCPPTPTSPCMDINRAFAGFPDWTHSNGVVYSPDDGNLLLSIRHMLWVIKIDYEDGQGSGDILWRLGAQGDFTLTNGGIDDWFYAQHYPTILSPNSTGVFTLGVFDNGNVRGVFDTPSQRCNWSVPSTCYSRVPIYQVDEVGMTATILWQYNLAPVFTSWSGAVVLKDDRVFFGVGSPSDDPLGSRYMEVTHDPSPQIVLQMEVSGQCAYRMVHLPSLYPGVQW